MTFVDLVCAIATTALLCCSAGVRPKAGRCPPAWYVNGIRPSGTYECLRIPGGDPQYDGAGGWPDRAIDLPGSLRSRIYCTGGSHPIVVTSDREGRAVGCQR